MPEPGRLVVVNTTPIIALAVADQFTLLQHLYSQIVLPPAVQAEVIAGGASGVGVRELQAASWVRVLPLQDPRRADLLTDLDRGEAEVLALAQELGAGLVINEDSPQQAAGYLTPKPTNLRTAQAGCLGDGVSSTSVRCLASSRIGE